MGAAADPAVADHLDLVADRIDDLGELVERGTAAVELTPAVVGNHDRVGPDLDRAARVGGAHHAFEAKRAAPLLADLGGGRPVHRSVEHGVEIARDRDRLAGAFENVGVEIGQREFFAQGVIQPPARFHRVAEQIARSESRRRGEPAARAAFALARNDGVHGQRDRVEFRRLAALDHACVEPLVLVDVKLEQLGSAGQRGDFLDAHRGEAGNPEPHPELVRRARHRTLALPVEHALQGGG